MTLGSGETLKALNRVNPLKFVLVEKPLGRHLQPSGELFRLPQNLNLVDKSGGAGGAGAGGRAREMPLWVFSERKA